MICSRLAARSARGSQSSIRRWPNARLPIWSWFCRKNTNAVDGSRSEEHTSELQSLMRISYAVFCLKKKKHNIRQPDQWLKNHLTSTSNTHEPYMISTLH